MNLKSLVILVFCFVLSCSQNITNKTTASSELINAEEFIIYYNFINLQHFRPIKRSRFLATTTVKPSKSDAETLINSTI
mgnify:CR=1 FL=1